MKVYVADAHEHIRRMVSVVKMATVSEKWIEEEKRSVVRLCWQNYSMQRTHIKVWFLFKREVFVA
jgi:hypothetical protein